MTKYDYEDEFKNEIQGYLSGGSIGGRDTDFRQVGYSLSSKVKEFFPINCVPENIVNHLKNLNEKLKEAEFKLEAVLRIIIVEVEK